MFQPSDFHDCSGLSAFLLMGTLFYLTPQNRAPDAGVTYLSASKLDKTPVSQPCGAYLPSPSLS